MVDDSGGVGTLELLEKSMEDAFVYLSFFATSFPSFTSNSKALFKAVAVVFHSVSFDKIRKCKDEFNSKFPIISVKSIGDAINGKSFDQF